MDNNRITGQPRLQDLPSQGKTVKRQSGNILLILSPIAARRYTPSSLPWPGTITNFLCFQSSLPRPSPHDKGIQRAVAHRWYPSHTTQSGQTPPPLDTGRSIVQWKGILRVRAMLKGCKRGSCHQITHKRTVDRHARLSGNGSMIISVDGERTSMTAAIKIGSSTEPRRE